MTELRDPLVPPEVDLRDFGFMPLDVRRLLTSETWIEASEDPRLGHALMSLWAEAWHQVPAGSLPDNDRVLQRLSMCPTAKEWQRVRERALAGWVKCSDGLLYHPVVSEKALDSWQKKLAQRERTAAATAAREAKRRARDDERNAGRDDPRNGQRDVQRNESRDVHQGIGRVKGEGDKKPPAANTLPTGTSPVAAAGSLIYPEKLSQAQCAEAAKALSGHPKAQDILDEVAGAMKYGKRPVDNPLALIVTLAAQGDGFRATYAPRIQAEREKEQAARELEAAGRSPSGERQTA